MRASERSSFGSALGGSLNSVLGAFDVRLVRASRYAGLTDRRGQAHLHYHAQGFPAASLHLPVFQPGDADRVAAERVVRAFQLARQREVNVRPPTTPKEDAWDWIGGLSHRPFIDLLTEGDVDKVAAVLVNALHDDVSRGLCHDGHQLTYKLACDPAHAAEIAALIVDRFVALAEALGVLFVEFPEWGRWGENLYVDLADLYGRVEEAFGASLAIEECFGLYGIKAGDSIITFMTPDHAYAAMRIGEVLAGTEAPHVCEIGGGYGGAALYGLRRNKGRYTIIDLPVINALQGYFLIRTCGAEQVRLYGEDEGGQPVSVQPNWTMTDVPDDTFDLVLSQESLPEIDRAHAMAYLTEIARTGRLLLSINQETGAPAGDKGFRHNIVPELIAAHGGFRRRYRFPYWLRKGEVEELYEVT